MTKKNMLIIREDLETEGFEIELYLNGKNETKKYVKYEVVALDIMLSLIEVHSLDDENTLTIHFYRKIGKNGFITQNFKIESIQELIIQA